ncbi:MAG: aminoacetone oxidase family FAD-binding enzyme, partial [Pseudomonadota bacterium]
LQTCVNEISHDGHQFRVSVNREGAATVIHARHLVVACGGKSIPKMGATGLGYRIAEQFGLPVEPTRAGLVPLTFSDGKFKPLAGVAVPARVSTDTASFDEAVLFTHRGLSGPAVLQASSYWDEGESVTVNLTPQANLLPVLQAHRKTDGRKAFATVLSQYLPTRLIEFLAPELHLQGNMADQSDAQLGAITDALSAWHLLPSGSEGYRTAEVTLGGVDTAALSSKTMAAKDVPGLYFIGECVDVTGWLGGYNFQWAWSSGWAAGQAIKTQANS